MEGWIDRIQVQDLQNSLDELKQDNALSNLLFNIAIGGATVGLTNGRFNDGRFMNSTKMKYMVTDRERGSDVG